MIGHLTQWILDTLRTNAGWSVFTGVMIEQVIIPIPSPAIIMGAGFILVPAGAAWGEAFGRISAQIVFPAVIASTFGAIGAYAVGRYGGKAFVDRFQKFLGFSWADVESLGAHFTKRGEAVSLFALRAAPIVPLSLISVVSGVLEIPLGLFILWSVLGTIPRCYLLGFLGWKMGGEALTFARGVDRFESLITGLMVAGVVAGILYVRWRVRKGLAADRGSNRGGGAGG